PGIRREQLREPLLLRPDVVDLERELHGQALPLRLEDRAAVLVEVEVAADGLVRKRPELARLAEVVDVLGEADLVDAALEIARDERLDRGDRVDELLALVPQVHVVVDDHGGRRSSLTEPGAELTAPGSGGR